MGNRTCKSLKLLVYRLQVRGPLKNSHFEAVGVALQLELCRTQLFLHALRLGDIEGEAAAMNESTVFEKSIGVDQDMLDRPIFAAQSRRMLSKRLTTRQAPQNFGDHGGVDVKLSNVMSHILLTLIAKEVELGLIRAKNAAIGSDPVESDRCIVEEIGEVPFTSQKRHFVGAHGCSSPPYQNRHQGQLDHGSKSGAEGGIDKSLLLDPDPESTDKEWNHDHERHGFPDEQTGGATLQQSAHWLAFRHACDDRNPQRKDHGGGLHCDSRQVRQCVHGAGAIEITH